MSIPIEESVELSALVNQIIPADETPGATEIGVVYFIDVALYDPVCNVLFTALHR